MQSQELQQRQLPGPEGQEAPVAADRPGSQVELHSMADQDPVAGQQPGAGHSAARDGEASDDLHGVRREVDRVAEAELQSVKAGGHGLMRAQQDGAGAAVREEPAGDTLEVARSGRRRDQHDQARLHLRQGVREGCRALLDPHVDVGEQARQIDRTVRVRQGEPSWKGLGRGRDGEATDPEAGLGRKGDVAVGLRHPQNLAAPC